MLERDHFIDASFTASDDSLVGDKSKEAAKKWVGKINWRRAGDIFGSQVRLFSNSINPSDILQGGLGDSYFLGTLACLAE